jgi:hypothetical protein
MYNVPIDVFPGINGMQPNLALVYNSQSGNTMVGYGWNLTGISTLALRPKNIYYDGKVEPIRTDHNGLSNDAWVLDGQKLILVCLSMEGNAMVAEYRTEMSSAIKVAVYYYNQSNLKYYPSKAKVYYPDGKIAEYWLNKKDILFAITKVTDSNGNTIEYSYVDDNNALRIASIQYGANSIAGTSHFAKVEFTYSERNDKTTMYEAGEAFINNHLLNTIRVSYNNYLLHTYTLSYDNRYYSQLTGISLKSNNEDYSPLTFDYNAAAAYTKIQVPVYSGWHWPNDTRENFHYFSCRYFETNPKDAVISWPIKNPYPQNSNISEYGTANDDVIVISSPNTSRLPIPMGANFRTAFSADLKGTGRDYIIKVNQWSYGYTETLQFSAYNYTSNTPQFTKNYTLAFASQDICGFNGQYLLLPRLYYAGDFNGDGTQEIFAITVAAIRGGCRELDGYGSKLMLGIKLPQ